jgi:ketosteroid isomerase-like protein
MVSKIGTIASACLMLATTAAYAMPDAGAVKETVRKFLKATNDGDRAAGAAVLTADGSVIDEFAPFRWDNFDDWGTAYAAYNSQNGVTHARATLLKFSHVNVEGDHAYAVATVIYAYTEGGRARKENGTETYTLQKTAGAWRIASFAWMSRGGVDQGADATAILDTVHGFTSMTGTPSPAPDAIVDEFAPYHWTGPTAHADWYAGLQKGLAQSHASDLALALAAPDQLSVNGDKGYAVFPTVITDHERGKTVNEHGQFAFALEKSNGAWHVTSWAWATR